MLKAANDVAHWRWQTNGFSPPFHQLLCKRLMAYPVLHETVMDIFMIAPMIFLMAVQRHRWQHIAEMAGAMLVGPAILIACAQFGLHHYLPGGSIQALFSWVDPTTYLGMLVAMLYRREHYLGHTHTVQAS